MLQVTLEPSKAKTTLEFMLLTLCRSFELKAKGAASLLANNNQKLLLMSMKGANGDYKQVSQFFHELHFYSMFLSQLVSEEYKEAIKEVNPKKTLAVKQNFTKILALTATGCYSKNRQVIELCLKTLRSITRDF